MRCDICVDQTCGGEMNCDCSSCDKIAECHRVLSATVRITTKCSQSCNHCCFDCSPKCDDMMTVDKAKEIASFLKANGANQSVNLMGGEFWLNPNWGTILSTLASACDRARLVTNSDWAADPTLTEKVITFARNNPNLYFGLSKDRWHSNEHVATAEEVLIKHDIPFRIATEEEGKAESIVPVGRSRFESACLYGMFATYCSNPQHRYSFLIDEEGKIYKCNFGSWDYANTSEHLDGSFRERFKEFNDVFYSHFISNCRSCLDSYRRAEHKRRQQEQQSA